MQCHFSLILNFVDGLHQLTVQAVDHKYNRIQSAVEVGIVKYDHWVLTTQFQVQTLQSISRLCLNLFTCCRVTYQGNCFNGWVLSQCLTRNRTKTVNGVPDTFWQTGCFCTLGQNRTGQRTQFSRLVYSVQPAASAGAIFQVDSINGVFHGVITATGPIGLRTVKLVCWS